MSPSRRGGAQVGGPRWLVVPIITSFAGCESRPCVVPCEVGEACLIAGTGTAALGDEAMCGRDTSLYLPSGIFRGPTGALEVVDFNNWRLRRLDDEGRFHTVAGNGTHAGATLGIPPSESPLENPIAATLDPLGGWYLVEYHVPRVLHVGDAGVFEADTGTGVEGTAGEGGPAVAAELMGPSSVAADSAGALWIADMDGDRLLRRGADGGLQRISGSASDAPGGPPLLLAPAQLALDEERGVLYVSASEGHQVWALDLATERLTPALGTGTAGRGEAGVAPADFALDTPRALAVDGDGDLLVGDAGNRRIVRLSSDGTVTTVVSGGGDPDAERQPASDLPLRTPAAMHWDGVESAWWLADMTGHRVYRLPLE